MHFARFLELVGKWVTMIMIEMVVIIVIVMT